MINRYNISWDGEYLKYGEWLAAPRNSNLFFKRKIVIRRTDDKLLCSYDNNNFVGLNSIHCVQLKSEDFSYKYLLAIINSKLCNWFFRHENFHMVGKPLAEVKVVFVERLPIVLSGYALNSTSEQLTHRYYMVVCYNYVSLLRVIIFPKYQPVSSNLVEQTAYPLCFNEEYNSSTTVYRKS